MKKRYEKPQAIVVAIKSFLLLPASPGGTTDEALVPEDKSLWLLQSEREQSIYKNNIWDNEW